ncbi:MAG: hypothetical protein QM710_06245 [Flavobacterium sp.]
MESLQKTFRPILLFFAIVLFSSCSNSDDNPSSAKYWKMVSPGYGFTTAIRSDGTLWAWGYNEQGQLGTGNTVNSNIPVQIGTDSDWKAIASGGTYACAIKTNGTLWAWGRPILGMTSYNGTIGPIWTPFQVGTSTNWKWISAGDASGLGIKTDGTLWTWGTSNGFVTEIDGQTQPTQLGTDANWKSASIGVDHISAVKNNGTLWSWGYNFHGAIGNNVFGDGPITIVNYKQQEYSQASNWNNTFAGKHTVALKNDGTLWAWGDNSSGELGIGNLADKNIPIQIGTNSDWKTFYASYIFTLAIKNDGTLWAWGENAIGQLGDGTTTNKNIPVKIGVDADWQDVIFSNDHSFAKKADNTLWGWGYNAYGQLGNNTNTDSYVPVLIPCPQ